MPYLALLGHGCHIWKFRRVRSFQTDRAGKLSRSIIISRQPVTCQSKLNKINGILLSGLSVPDKSLLGEDMLPFVMAFGYLGIWNSLLFLKFLLSIRLKNCMPIISNALTCPVYSIDALFAFCIETVCPPWNS